MGEFLERLSESLALPPEAVAGAPRVTLSGTSRVCIEHHRGLLAYSGEEVEVSGGSVRYRVRGTHLLLQVMTQEQLQISGDIFGVDVEGQHGSL